MKSKITQWSDVTLGMYIELVDIMADMDMEDNGIELVSVFLDIDVEVVKDIDYDEFVKHIDNLAFINTPIPKRITNKVTLGDIELELIDFYKLEFGAFIDIENLLSVEYLNNLPKILSILYRKQLTPSDALNRATYEPYGDWLDIRGVLFENVPITALYGVIEDYMVFRNMIQTSYEGLFQDGEEEFTEADEAEFVKGMTSKEREDYEQEKSITSYGWDLLLLRLANNEPLKMLEAAGLPLIFALNVLGMQKSLKMG